MKSFTLLFTLVIGLLPTLINAQDFYPLAQNNKWTYELYDEGVAFATSSLEIINIMIDSDDNTVYEMEGVETGLPDMIFYVVKQPGNENETFLSVDLNNDNKPDFINFLYHSYTVGDTVTILLNEYIVKDYGNYTTMKGLSFDDCLLLESIERELDLIMAPDVGLVAQFEAKTPDFNMLELIEFFTDTQIISDVEEELIELKMDIYPNPTSDFLTIEGPSELTNSELKLFDVTGSVVKKENFSGQTTINTSDLPKGQYFLIVTSQDRSTWSEKVIIE